jgi:hypothetical protein
VAACAKVDVAELDRPTVTVDIEIPIRADQLFEILEDGDAWPKWLTALDKVTWTSPDPKRIGTTRSIDIGGNFTADEKFIAWETDRRMAFYFTGCSRPMFRAFAEDYRVEPVAGGCRLTWSVLVRPRGIPEWSLKVVGPLLAVALRRYLVNLRKYAAVRNPGETDQGLRRS